MSAQRTCLLVLGMHRSGTSALSGALSISGAGLPKTLMLPSETNKTGYWESQALVNLNDRIFEELGYDWHDFRVLKFDDLERSRRDFYRSEIRRLIVEEYGSSRLFILKDPRLCLLFDLYSELLESLEVQVVPILIFRNPLEVCASLASRNNLTASQTEASWLRHVLDSERSTRSFPRYFAVYPGSFFNWPDLVGGINSLIGGGVRLSSDEQVCSAIGRFVYSGYTHYSFSVEDLNLSQDVSPLTKNCFEALLQLQSGHLAATSILDHVSDQFNLTCGIMGRLVSDERYKSAARIGDLESEISRLRSCLVTTNSNLQEAQESAGRQFEFVQRLQTSLAERDREVEKLQREKAGLLEILNESSFIRRLKFAVRGGKISH